jgi:uncharacterized protein YgbK (DUF1537 family)
MHLGADSEHSPVPTFVLDDDPTGTQACADVRVLLRWDGDEIARALRSRVRAIHLLTNSRAVHPARARAITCDATRAALAAAPAARLLLRGDSTLRGHVLEEYLGVEEARGSAGKESVLLLVPALPAAGRFTLGGIHWMRDASGAVPLDETEYARDGGFTYSSSWLLRWLEDRSDGYWRARAGASLSLGELRHGGPEAVRAALHRAAAHGGGCVPDAMTDADLAIIAAGLRLAESDGVPITVRCAPAFAAEVSGTRARRLVPIEPSCGGTLMICGSYVAATTGQLERLTAARPDTLVEVRIPELAAEDPRVASAEVARVARAASARIAIGGFAIVATPRTRPPDMRNLSVGRRIVRNLARIAEAVRPRPDVLLAKGGITSHVTLESGVGATEADVVGPIAPGVGLWAAAWPDGTPLRYVVLPGNVGDDDLLISVVDGFASAPAV